MKVKDENYQNKGTAVVIGAVLDTCSGRSFCTRRPERQLHLQGKPISVSIGTVTSEEVQISAETVGLRVTRTKPRREKQVVAPDVVVVERLPFTLPTAIADVHDVARWRHFHGTAPTSYQVKREIDLLISQDVPDALIPLEARGGADEETYAVSTRLRLRASALNQPTLSFHKGIMYNLQRSRHLR